MLSKSLRMDAPEAEISLGSHGVQVLGPSAGIAAPDQWAWLTGNSPRGRKSRTAAISA